MKPKAFIFDLDGTLLNTLPDVTALTNAVLDTRGYPHHTQDAIKSFFGEGVRVFMRRAAPEGVDEAEIDELLCLWRSLYPQYGYSQTKPYPGIVETLDALRAFGVKLGVLSNKFDRAAREVVAAFFPGVFDLVRGEGPDTPRKPDPTGFLAMAESWCLEPAEIGLVGDSGGTDMAVAHAVGALPIGVSWGYNSVENLMAHGARMVFDEPSQLLDLIECI